MKQNTDYNECSYDNGGCVHRFVSPSFEPLYSIITLYNDRISTS